MTPSGMKHHVEEAKNKSMKNHLLDLPYKGERRNTHFHLMKRYVNKILPENVKVQTAYTGKRSSSCFKTKDNTKLNINTILYTRCKILQKIVWAAIS